MKSHCPKCGEIGVPPSGPKDSKILIIGEHPGDEDLAKGRPFVGASGSILRSELTKIGVDLSDCRVMNMWLHEPTEDEDCLKVGKDLVLEEAKGKKTILLVGSDVVSTFTEYSVSKVCGLKIQSVFSCKHVWAILNPAILFHNKGVGEFRLAIEKWGAFLKRSKLV